MIKRQLWISTFLCATVPAVAQAGKCIVPNVPIQATFLATAAPDNAISNDDASKPYKDGVSGVTAFIHRCDGSRATNDATINLLNAQRKLTFQFPAAEAGSLYLGIAPPSFAGGAPFSSAAFVNVKNILGTSSTIFYTRVSFDISISNRSGYSLAFHPPDGSCPSDYPCVPDLGANTGPSDENYPKNTAWVKVTYTPAPAGQPGAQWIVDGTFLRPGETTYQRGTLYGKQHEGQYQMPFKLVITALSPL